MKLDYRAAHERPTDVPETSCITSRVGLSWSVNNVRILASLSADSCEEENALTIDNRVLLSWECLPTALKACVKVWRIIITQQQEDTIPILLD